MRGRSRTQLRAVARVGWGLVLIIGGAGPIPARADDPPADLDRQVQDRVVEVCKRMRRTPETGKTSLGSENPEVAKGDDRLAKRDAELIAAALLGDRYAPERANATKHLKPELSPDEIVEVAGAIIDAARSGRIKEVKPDELIPIPLVFQILGDSTRVKFTTTPTGAAIEVNGVPAKKPTTHTLVLNGKLKYKIRLKLNGYEDYADDAFDPSNSEEVKVSLKKK
ncbi:MAG: hypothetical protein J2P46_12435 [Zavarzinella sp.]|nr:hypothetical protein [Zavarzinella sp.]